jgi:excisionase family DNA binding protein
MTEKQSNPENPGAPVVDANQADRNTADTMLRYSDAAQMLGIPTSTLQSMVCRKEVPHVRLGRRLVVFSRRALEAWMLSRTVAVKGVQ